LISVGWHAHPGRRFTCPGVAFEVLASLHDFTSGAEMEKGRPIWDDPFVFLTNVTCQKNY